MLCVRRATTSILIDPPRNARGKLAEAIGRGDADRLRLLLREQADPTTSAGYSVAHLAAAAGHAVALHWTATLGQEATVAQLLEHGVNIDSGMGGGMTALGVPDLGRFAVVKLLLSRRASMTADEDGDTALVYAAQRGYTQVVERLLAAGADPAHVNAGGDNALDCAQREKRKGVVALLRHRGLKPARQ